MGTSYHKRKWLNPASHYSSGAIAWGANSDRELTLSIWDCSRKIDLELDFYSEDDKKRTIHKLEVLEEAVQDLLWTARNLEPRQDTWLEDYLED